MRTTNRYMLLVAIFIFSVTIFLLNRQIWHQAVNFTYLTRPLWDKPAKPFNIRTHYFSHNLTVKEHCEINKFTLNEKETKVFDAILFSVELDLLEIRIRELYDYVDKFIIIESNSTFTGLEKPFVFHENRGRFKFAESKIEYGSVTVPPRRPGQDPFDIEAAHRVAMNTLISRAGTTHGDWVLMMDVDEIPSWHTVRMLRKCGGIPSPMHLQLRNYLYSFEFLLDMDSWRGKAVKYPMNYGHARSSDIMLADAGWHCSFCFKTIQDFLFKMKGYSHADRVHQQSVLNPKRIQEVICEGSDIFDMLPEAYTWKDLVQKWGKLPKQTSGIELPMALLKDPVKYRFLLPGGCIRDKS